jgi:tRNA-splicing ligase RtcB
MDLELLNRVNDNEWHIDPRGPMKVPGIIYGPIDLVKEMDHKVYEQVCNVATLPGIVKASYAMPDAHWGYGFPIGGVAAFDPGEGVISAGGVGFDISCGVRLLLTGLTKDQIVSKQKILADELFREIPAGVGSKSSIRLKMKELDQMLRGGAKWAVDKGYGLKEDLDRIEENGEMKGALPEMVSEHAKKRQQPEMGTLGSGNHYLEVQEVKKIFDETTAKSFGLKEGEVVISIHCGSRGLGHQIGTDYLKLMAQEAKKHGIKLPDRELACAPINSKTGQNYLGAMRSAINCALANREILTHFTRAVFDRIFPGSHLRLLYDVSHNTCKVENHKVDGKLRKLFVHRKGATRSFGPGREELPSFLRQTGQPVFIGGSMGTGSYVLAGTDEAEGFSFSSSCHGAGRSMSRNQARKTWRADQVIQELAGRGIFIRSGSKRGVAEEAPGAYKDVTSVIEAAHEANLSKKIAYLKPLVCVKG